MTQMAVMVFLLIFFHNLIAVKSFTHYNNTAPPEPPYNVTVLRCYANVVFLEWQFDEKQGNVTPKLSFIVEYNTSFVPNEWVVAARLPAYARQAKINLTLWATYNFRVKASNEMGVEKASAISKTQCRTPQGRPDRHPRNVRTVGDKTNYLVVEWEPMLQIDHNGPGFVYNITVRDKDGGLTLNTLETNYTVGRKEILVNNIYQPYLITVGAENKVARPIEKAQAILGYSGEGAPTVIPANFELDPDEKVTATSAAFRWDPVDTSPEAMQGEFKGYKVRYWRRDEKGDMVSMHEKFIPATSDANVTRKGRQSDKIRAWVNYLPSFSEIEANVVAVNNYFTSECSNIVSLSTLDEEDTIPGHALILDAETDNRDLSEFEYSNTDVDSTPLYTKNNTRIQLTCAGTFPNPVGNVREEWRMLDNRFIIPPSHPRLVTSLTISPAHHYTGTLTIHNVIVTDSGNFTFSLLDESGQEVGCSGRVQVFATPTVMLPSQKNIFLQPREMFELNCRFTQPFPDDTVIEWFSNGVEVAGESTSKLLVLGTQGVNATYSCLGENRFGKGRKSDEIAVYIIQGEVKRCDKDNPWLQTPINITAERPCPEEDLGVMTRPCGDEGQWLDEDRSQCVSRGVEDLNDEMERMKDGLLLKHISVTTLLKHTNPDRLGSKAIAVLTPYLERLLKTSSDRHIAADKSETEDFARAYTESISNLLDSKTAELWKTLENQTLPTTMLDFADSMTDIYSESLDEGELKTLTFPNIVLQVGKTNPMDVKDIVFSEDLVDVSQEIYGTLKLDSKTVDSLAGNDSIRFSVIYYKNISSLLPEEYDLKSSPKQVEVSKDILAFNIFPAPSGQLDPPLKLTFYDSNKSPQLGDPLCVHLNISENKWESRGCYTRNQGENYTECFCSHLANYALLMRAKADDLKQPPLSLSVISLVGCSISVLALILTVVIHICLWRYVKSDQATILMHICICLTIAMILFTAGVEQTKYEYVCTSIAVALHFFYLASFFMMLASALETLWTIVVVFTTGSNLKVLLIGAWVFPVIIVAITTVVSESRGHTRQYCWLPLEDNMRWAFIGPVVVIVAVNFIVIGKLIYILLSTQAAQTEDTRTKIKIALRGMCMLTPVLGVTWVLGVLVGKDDHYVFDHIFSAVNSLQGLFIFITQCVLNRKIYSGLTNHWRRFRSERWKLTIKRRKQSVMRVQIKLERMNAPAREEKRSDDNGNDSSQDLSGDIEGVNDDWTGNGQQTSSVVETLSSKDEPSECQMKGSARVVMCLDQLSVISKGSYRDDTKATNQFIEISRSTSNLQISQTVQTQKSQSCLRASQILSDRARGKESGDQNLTAEKALSKELANPSWN